MSKIYLCGDVHGNWSKFKKLLHDNKHGVTIQLGDLGLGFPEKTINPKYFFDLNEKYYEYNLRTFNYEEAFWKFIRGNHDSPKICKYHKNNLGDFGSFKDIFFVAGAWSIDQDIRKEGVDWWSDEELTMKQSYEALDLYTRLKPDIVISHDCPTDVLEFIHGSKTIKTRTGQLLNSMYHEHHPKYWYFAHHHISWEKVLFGTRFKCLNCLEVGEIL